MSKINRLGFGIVVFDDICHLKNITSEIRDYCDDIVVCLQNVSYHGDPINPNVVDYVEKLKSEKLVDDIIWFTAEKKYEDDIKSAPRRIETDKRNFILDHLEKNLGCSHVMVIDSDEFYDGEDFKAAKEIINNTPDISVSYCNYVNYYRDYKHLLVWPFLCYVPFISEAKYRFDFDKGSFNKPSDPTRRYLMGNDEKFCILSFKFIKMHHLSWIRTNIADKIDSWSAKRYFDDVKDLKQRMIDRYNNYEDGENAIIMFNTPEFNVCVNKLNDQYIHPKYKIEEL